MKNKEIQSEVDKTRCDSFQISMEHLEAGIRERVRLGVSGREIFEEFVFMHRATNILLERCRARTAHMLGRRASAYPLDDYVRDAKTNLWRIFDKPDFGNYISTHVKNFAGWYPIVIGSAYNQALRDQRNASKASSPIARLSDSEDQRSGLDIPDSRNHTDEWLASLDLKELELRFAVEVRKLPRSSRAVVSLLLSGLSKAEVARRLNCSSSWVSQVWGRHEEVFEQIVKEWKDS